MEDIRLLLEQGNSGQVLQAADKLHKAIRTRCKDGSVENDGLILLWELIGSKKVLCANSCRYLLVNLVEAGLIEPAPAITQLLSKLSLGYCYTGIVSAVSQILALIVKASVAKTGGYKCPYSVNSSQHPFICILRSTPSSWDIVLDQFLYLLDHTDADVRKHSLELLKPVYLYLFCDPNYHIHFGVIRSLLFKDLIQRSSSNEEFLNLTLKLISWLPYSQPESVKESYNYIYLFIHFLQQNDLHQLLKERTLLITSLMKNQVKFGFEISDTVNLLKSCKDLIDNWDIHFIIFNQIIEIMPLGSQNQLVDFCYELIQDDRISKYTAGLMVCSFLQSLSFDSTLSSSTQKKADIVRYCLKNTLREKTDFVNNKILANFECEVSSAIMCHNLISLISSSQQKREDWLQSRSHSESRHLSDHLPVISSIFLFTNNTQEIKLALCLLQNIAKEDPSNSSTILTLILHKLAAAEKLSEPRLYLALLQALPLMAGDKNCVSLILKLVGSLVSKPHMTPLRLKLLMDLWRQEPRCFQFLHKALEEVPDEQVFTEVQIARAVIMKEIVRTHAGQHGSDLLPLLSNILNQCTTPQVTLASKLALESIYTLCHESVIDIRTTIKVIAPKCVKDMRTSVLVQYCNILGLVPTFRVTGTEYAKFTEECISWLWKKVTSDYPEISCAAYKAIANYPLEATKLKMLPGFSRQGLKLPAAYCATPQDAARKPEDVLPYVPGVCWVNLVSKSSGPKKKEVLEAKNHLLQSLMKSEIKDLPNSVYHPNTTMRTEAEPLNYNHLPDRSLLRAVISFIIEKKDSHPSQADNVESPLYMMLSLVSKDYGRHLPPLDWSSLDVLLERSELRKVYLQAVCVQAAHSRSARILLERQLSSEQDLETSMACMQMLKYVSLAVPPPQLAGFTNRCLQLSLSKASAESGSEELKSCLKAIDRSFNKSSIPEANRLALSTCVENMFDSFPEELQVFQDYLDTICLLPNKSVERLSSPALWWEATTDKLAKAAHIRARLAVKQDSDSPLTWMNELIEAVKGTKTGDCSFMLRHLVTILDAIRVKSFKSVIAWLLELMGQISAKLRKSGSETSLLFLLDVFCVTVIMLTESDSFCVPRSQLSVSRSSRQVVLPVSLHRLCVMSPGLAGQLADWTLRLSKKDLPGGFSTCLADCLSVFKSADSWKEAFMWARIVSTDSQV